ncbi:hypothetical protein GCM10027317_14170 [Massilia agri]
MKSSLWAIPTPASETTPGTSSDTATIGPDGDVVFTASHLNRHFAGQVKPGEERYELWRLTRD